MYRRLTLAMAVLILASALRAVEPPAAKDQQWGDLTGRFIFDGDPPKPVELNVNKDKEIVQGPILSESLLVDAKTHGLANVFVWLIPDPEKPLIEHSDYVKGKSEPVLLSMKGLRFQPHCVVFRTGQTLKIVNDSPVGHNPQLDSQENLEVSRMISSGGPVEKILKNSELAPWTIHCNVHPWMSAYYLCQDHPYMALTSPAGEFTIKNLPIGKHSFSVWHESGRYLTKARRNGEKQEWKKGRIELDIRPGRNDLGDVLVPASSLKRQ